jgi:pimeloyl-ACP methyl ester carboxylesterase
MLLSVLLLAAGVVQSADSVPIHYSVEGKGDPALVFVHCGGCDRHFWDDQVTAFAKDHRVVTIDMPGHGESGSGRTDWSMEAYGEDVTRVVTKLGLKHVVLIGSSLGGPIVLEAARRMPERVVAIVPVDTLLNVEQRMPAEQVDAIMKQVETDFRGQTAKFTVQYLFAPSTSVAVRERVLAKVTSADPKVALPILRAALTYDPVPALREIKVPIRAINSDLSPTNLEGNRKVAPQFDVVIMKGVGHYLMIEDPARFNELLRGVLRDVERRPAARAARSR